VYQLMTLRADGQFNTTIYTEDDRFRGIKGERNVVLMNTADIERLDLTEGGRIRLSTVASDGIVRALGGLKVKTYPIPEGCIASYYPECNVLVPVWHYGKESKVPAAKSVPVRIEKDG
jgi:anaerobic selenocysteine-containing dehydrogenase